MRQRREVARDEHLTVPRAHGDAARVTDARDDQRFRSASVHAGYRMCAAQLSRRQAHRLIERQAILQQLLNHVWNDLGVRLRQERVAVRSQPGLELGVVLDDAVVHDDDLARSVRVRMRVHIGSRAMRGPPRVADALMPDNGLVLHKPPEIVQFAHGAPDREVARVVDDSDACAVVPAVGEVREPFQQDAGGFPRTGVSEYPAHRTGRSVALRLPGCRLRAFCVRHPTFRAGADRPMTRE